MCPLNSPLNFLHAPCKVTQKILCEGRKGPLGTAPWGWARKERALAMAISNLRISQLFQAPRPITQPHPHTHDFISKIETHWHVSWKVSPLRFIQPCPQPGCAGGQGSPWICLVEAHHHLRIDGQRAVPQGGKLSCWLLSAHHEEDNIM